MANPPLVNEAITPDVLDRDPLTVYRQLRIDAPVCWIKAAEKRYVNDKPEFFSSDNPMTPMKRAFQAHTLMRKDRDEHRRERMAVARAFASAGIRNKWVPQYQKLDGHDVGCLPRGAAVGLVSALSGTNSARGLATRLGPGEASADDMHRRSQTLVDSAGNFGLEGETFARSVQTNVQTVGRYL